MAGSRSELTDFSDGCIQSSKFSIRMSFPYTALCIPSHTFFEVIYNRMANDLALWQPRSPLLRPARKSSDPVVRPFQFTECKLYDDPEGI
jgi:hypothetical protein